MLNFTFDRPLIQGDVILKKLTTLPENVQKLLTDKKILQMSEVTGHHHHFRPDAKVEVFTLPQETTITDHTTITPNEQKVILVYEDTQLFHGRGFEVEPLKTGTGEHQALTVPAGVYYVDIVREYDYDRMEERRVVD